jgi:multisubunit Na+/H+ antiporter MnhB subunit
MFFNVWNFYIRVGAILCAVDLAYLFFCYDFLFDFSVEHAYELAFDRYLCEKIFARWMLAQVLESRDIEGEIMVGKAQRFTFFIGAS